MSLNKTKGFTLIEIMVAMTIFAIVALVASSAVITVNQINQRVQGLKIATDNLHFALAALTFKLRSGETYHCVTDLSDAWVPDSYAGSQDCPLSGQGGTGIVFSTPKFSADQERVAYRLKGSALEYWNGAWTTITVSNLSINNFRFFVDGSQSGGTAAPRVFIALSGTAQSAYNQTPFRLQTLVSERL